MPGQRVYLGGLSYRAGDKDVEHFFRKYGRLREISLKNGYAFVEFEDTRDAEDAVYDLHGVDFMGEKVTIELARGTPHGRDKERWGHPPGGSRDRSSSRERGGRGRGGRDGDRPVWLEKYGPPTRTDYRVTVENLSSKVSWQDLKDFMRTAGEVTFADAHKNRRNEGVVEFATREDMETAIDKLDDTELNGRRIKLVPEKRLSPERKRGGGEYRGKRERSRSRSRGSRKSRSRSRLRTRSHSSAKSSRSKEKSPTRSKSRSMKTRSRSKGDSVTKEESD